MKLLKWEPRGLLEWSIAFPLLLRLCAGAAVQRGSVPDDPLCPFAAGKGFSTQLGLVAGGGAALAGEAFYVVRG